MPKKITEYEKQEQRRGYSEHDLGRAFSAVVDDGISLLEASKMYSVPYPTLQRRKSEGNSNPTFHRTGPKPVLSSEIEERLVEAIIVFQRLGYGLGRAEIINLAKQIDVKQRSSAFCESNPSDMWFKRFSQRNNFCQNFKGTGKKSRRYGYGRS